MIPKLEYYVNILDEYKTQCENIYVSSDNIDCYFCKFLIQKYNIKIFWLEI